MSLTISADANVCPDR